MTRETFYLITKDQILESAEFNGDMYPSGYGDEALEVLREVESEEQFRSMVEDFNTNHHNYEEELIYDKLWFVEEGKNGWLKGTFELDETIDFRNKYFDRFFSDYIFIRNLTETDYKFIDGDGVEGIIKANDTLRLSFGRLVEGSRNTLVEWLGENKEA